MSDSRPVIGIVTADEWASYGPWTETRCAVLQVSYTQAIQSAGGLAVLIPPDPHLVRHPDEILDRVDALILAGGADVNPDSYGADPDPATRGVTPDRDVLELALVSRAIERDMPVLGICRGMQILNVACGGTLIQHLPDVVSTDEHCRRSGTFEGNDHDVVVEPGTLAAQAAGSDRTRTFSHHHQAIAELGGGLMISARCPEDNVIEAIELREHTYVLGVQWHPEADIASKVIDSLVERARESVTA